MHPAYDAGESFYAVYGFDGQEWLSWTVEGWNASTVELVGGARPYDGLPGVGGGKDLPNKLTKSGCGCDATLTLPATGWLLGLLTVLAIRRR